MTYGSTVYGTDLYGDEAADGATATAALSAQDGDTSEVAGTRQTDAAVSAQDADNSAVAGVTAAEQIAALSAQDGDTAVVAGDRGVTAAASAQDADTATAVGTLGVTATVSGQDADTATVAGTRQLDAVLVGQDADTATLAGIQGAVASVLAPATITLTWDDSATHALTWADSATVQLTMADNEFTQTTIPASGENIERTFEIDEDGSDKDISGASLEWYILPSRSSDPADALIDHDTSGVSLTISDAAAGEVTLSVDQGVTDDLAGPYWLRLVVDDSGSGKQVWGGEFSIDVV